ncbi:MAG: FtsQ-type POTRA domain-containing protein [Holophagaceae bacterium]|uniref:FtsQ-type POTRA domain-containing protein n=1 Tax=Candidatus Geothrix odensensis TaxID=2954440 RepID=A0A936K6K5_9BACT|nr:FtsQ-type POTRA domain-containing protein [Candidatus Geothrix odensensis]
MSMLPRTRPKRLWMPWARAGITLVVIALAGWGLMELGTRYLGLQKLVIEQVNVSGCRGERQAEVQKLAEQLVLGKPLFWVDAEDLRARIEAKRWVRGLQIRKDPPDRLSLAIEERRPVLWLVRANGVFLVSDDGVLLDRVNQANLNPIPVVVDPTSQTDQGLARLVSAARTLREKQQGFYERITELRDSPKGPVAYIEGLPAPIYLSRKDVTKNVPNFQGLFVDRLSQRPDLAQLRYIDLRWDDEVAVGEPEVEPAPAKPRR